MEFWGLEVLPGATAKVDPGENKYLHLSQASLGEVKKDKGENVPIFVKVDGKKLVLGTLSSEKCAQIQYDLVFEKEFEISHGSKNTSIYFFGYKTAAMEEHDHESFTDSESESDEEVPLAVDINGKPEKEEKPKPAVVKSNAVKADASVKAKPKVEEPKKDVKVEADDDDDDDDSDSSEEDGSDDDEEMAEGEDDSDDEDEDDSSDEEDEETPKKAGAGNKRPSGSTSKTPVPEKKAKIISPVGNQKTGGKKGSVHVATPHPAKQGKTPANSDKSKQQLTPKSAGSVTCKSCSKTFNSDNALQAHTKAKHSAAK